MTTGTIPPTTTLDGVLADFDALKATIAADDATIATLTQTVADRDATIAGDVTQHAADVAATAAMQATLDATVAADAAAQAALQASLAAAQAQVDLLTQQLAGEISQDTADQATIAALNTQLADAQTQVANIQTQLAATVTMLNTATAQITVPSSSAPALMGIYGGNGAPALTRVTSFETWLGKPTQVWCDFFASNTWANSYATVGSGTDWSARYGWQASKQTPVFGTPKRMVLGVPLLTGSNWGDLDGAAAGTYNVHYTGMAQMLVGFGLKDCFLRLGWENDGNWYAWGGWKSAQFAAAFRNFVTCARAVTGSNFKYVYSPTGRLNSYPWEDAYPGSGFTDVISLDMYNTTWGAPNPNDPTARWGIMYNGRGGIRQGLNFAAACNKPIAFSEWGTGNRLLAGGAQNGGDDPYFIDRMAEIIKGKNVAYHCYWDYPHDYDAYLSSQWDGAAGMSGINGGIALPKPLAGARFKAAFGV